MFLLVLFFYSLVFWIWSKIVSCLSFYITYQNFGTKTRFYCLILMLEYLLVGSQLQKMNDKFLIEWFVFVVSLIENFSYVFFPVHKVNKITFLNNSHHLAIDFNSGSYCVLPIKRGMFKDYFIVHDHWSKTENNWVTSFMYLNLFLLNLNVKSVVVW